VSETIDQVARHVADTTPACGEIRVVGVDGRSGAGKSTFARALAERLDAPLLQLEGLYEGWAGLDRGVELLDSDVLTPLAAGWPGLAPQYDWELEAWGDPLAVPITPILVIEGVGVGAARVARHLSLLVWLDVPDELRKERALARDGEAYLPYWEGWAAQERALLAREDIAARADVIVRLTDTLPD
jgi:para-aminobenzoate synthetase